MERSPERGEIPVFPRRPCGTPPSCIHPRHRWLCPGFPASFPRFSLVVSIKLLSFLLLPLAFALLCQCTYIPTQISAGSGASTLSWRNVFSPTDSCRTPRFSSSPSSHSPPSSQLGPSPYSLSSAESPSAPNSPLPVEVQAVHTPSAEVAHAYTGTPLHPVRSETAVNGRPKNNSFFPAAEQRLSSTQLKGRTNEDGTIVLAADARVKDRSRSRRRVTSAAFLISISPSEADSSSSSTIVSLGVPVTERSAELRSRTFSSGSLRLGGDAALGQTSSAKRASEYGLHQHGAVRPGTAFENSSGLGAASNGVGLQASPPAQPSRLAGTAPSQATRRAVASGYPSVAPTPSDQETKQAKIHQRDVNDGEQTRTTGWGEGALQSSKLPSNGNGRRRNSTTTRRACVLSQNSFFSSITPHDSAASPAIHSVFDYYARESRHNNKHNSGSRMHITKASLIRQLSGGRGSKHNSNSLPNKKSSNISRLRASSTTRSTSSSSSTLGDGGGGSGVGGGGEKVFSHGRRRRCRTKLFSKGRGGRGTLSAEEEEEEEEEKDDDDEDEKDDDDDDEEDEEEDLDEDGGEEGEEYDPMTPKGPLDNNNYGEVWLPIQARPRRNRKSHAVRQLVKECVVKPSSLIYPLFVHDQDQSVDIESMPGQKRLSIADLVREVGEAKSYGVNAFMLFPSVDASLKSNMAEESYNMDGLVPRAIAAVKEKHPEVLVLADVALDPYSCHGQDGVVDEVSGKVLNDITVHQACKQAVTLARAGADMVCPSEMMDGRVSAIREALDMEGWTDISILAYSCKYASALYSPFRDALASHPTARTDKRGYQMDPSNAREAEREAELDAVEGADILMVKPGLPYLDILARIKEKAKLPLAVYSVSGEYAMLKAAALKGWISEKAVVLEILKCMRRAGADMIATYFAKDAARWMAEDKSSLTEPCY